MMCYVFGAICAADARVDAACSKAKVKYNVCSVLATIGYVHIQQTNDRTFYLALICQSNEDSVEIDHSTLKKSFYQVGETVTLTCNFSELQEQESILWKRLTFR